MRIPNRHHPSRVCIICIERLWWDVHLTENCGLLLPEDVILADCGFTIDKTAGMYRAKVKIPPFTREKSSSAS